MRVLDKFEKLVFDADIAAAILGNPLTAEYHLVDVDPASPDVQKLLGRDLYFLGVCGLVSGKPQTALTEPLDDDVVQALAVTFVKRIEDALR